MINGIVLRMVKPTEEQQSLAARLVMRARDTPEFGVSVAFVVLVVFFSVMNPVFFGIRNLSDILSYVSELGTMTIGETFLIISGEFDLSVGSVYAFGGFLAAKLAGGYQPQATMLGGIPQVTLPSPIAVLITLFLAGGIGYLNSVLTLRYRIPSFIATLGTMWAVRGIMVILTGGANVTWGGDNIIPTLLAAEIGPYISPAHLWFIGFTLVFHFVLTRTPYGNWVQATRGNRDTARAMGVQVDRVKTINFVLCSLMACIAGMLVMTRYNFVNASFGLLAELEAIAGAVIGGTYLFGGYGTILGCFLGALIVGMIRTGLVLAGAPGYWYQSFVGLILVVAAVINQKLRRAQS